MRASLCWLLVGLLGLHIAPHAQEQDYVQAAREILQQQSGKAPTPEEIWNALNRVIVSIYRDGKYQTGTTVAEQTYDFAKQNFGMDHPDTLGSVNNLAGLYRAQGRYGEAEPLYQRALAAREKVLGVDHPDTLGSVNNLAGLYRAQGRYGEAEPLYQRALAAREKVLGVDHPDTLSVQLNYAVTLVNVKKPYRALRLLERLEPRLLELAALRLRHTRQERVRRSFLTNQSVFQDVVLTLASMYAEPEFLELAARVMLRWKQVQGEEEAFLARWVRRRAGSDAEVRQLAGEIAGLHGELSHLVHQPEPNIEQLRGKLNALEAKEIRLAQINREFKRHLEVRQADVAAVRAALPRRHAALLEIRQYQPFDFKTGKFGKQHWAALLLSASGEMSLHDLGAVSKTVKAWTALRQTGSREAATNLYQNLFGQLDTQLKAYTTLYIAPDSLLHLVAIARLVTPDGNYWIQRQQLRQVQTGRHLIAGYDRDLDKPKGLLALGGVDYDGFGKQETSSQRTLEPTVLTDTRVATRAALKEIGTFGALDQTGPEAHDVARRYWDHWQTQPQIWMGDEAAESRLKHLQTPPNVLHLATHGFYLSTKTEVVDRPMILSGLALAGANRGLHGHLGPDGEDGILYALEVQALNLEDTELVALSACDTGRGTLDYSEGVYGLVRAFCIAGARNVLMSLWKVGDTSAREFMRRFYEHWLSGRNPQELAVALRKTQLSFIEDRQVTWRDPQVWAPFVLVEMRP